MANTNASGNSGNAGGGSSSSSQAPSSSAGSGGSSTGTSTGTGSGNPASSGSGSGSTTPTTAQAAVEAAASRLDSASSAGSTGARPAGDASSSGSQAAAASQTGQAGRTTAEQYHVPPREEWERVLGNARTGAVGGLMQELGVQSKEELTHAIGWMRQLRENPRGFLQQLMSEVGDDGQPEDDVLEDPEPDLRSEDGKLAYSAGTMKQIVANAVEQVRREFRAMVDPALRFAEDGQRSIEEAAVREEGESVARDVWTTLSKMPHFTENRKRIGEVYASIPAQTRQRVGSAAALHMAYNKVLAEEILPNLDTAAEEKALAKFRKDANASQGRTSVTTSTDQKPAIREGNVDDLAAHMAQISARMESGAQT